MSVYNGEKYLAKSINSVLNQSLSNFEFIIVNDCSIDNTPNILNFYLKKDKRIKVINNLDRLGLTKSLNIGLNSCKQQYIARIDHDDIWLKNKLEIQLDFMSHNAHVGLLGTYFHYIDENDSKVPTPDHFNVSNDKDIRKTMTMFNPICHSSVLIRGSLIALFKGYNKKYHYAQDYELWSKIMKVSSLHIFPEILCYHRILSENISVKNEKSQRFSALKIKYGLISPRSLSFNFFRMIIADIIIITFPKKIINIIRGYIR